MQARLPGAFVRLVTTLALIALCVLGGGLWGAAAQAQPRQPPRRPTRPQPTRSAPTQADFEALLPLPLAERIPKLEAFIAANPPPALLTRATEHLISAHAASADEKLKTGDPAGGVEEFRQAVALAPVGMSDRLFGEVVSQFPANLFLRGQAPAAIEVARLIEPKVQTDARRLVALAVFYLGIEQADEAARLAASALALAPDLAAAHQALGAARRLALRLDDAVAAYRRALELDPQSMTTRRNLADLLRATGKPDEALTLYRAQLGAEPNEPGARTGLVLALLDAGQREEAERELTAALAAAQPNLPLLVGAAYWFAAHNDAARALDLAGRAVQLEPRYTWGQIALARALLANQRAAAAERALRFARLYGRFPTLDYELANALAAAGLYEEAAEELARSFTLNDGQLETQLAGRTPARAGNFVELLAPERRASIFQAAPADTDANARMLKGLLALHLALDATDTPNAAPINATANTTASTTASTTAGDTASTTVSPTTSAAATAAALTAAVADFTAGDDDLRAFRQLYAADRLARRGLLPRTVLELTEAAKSGVDAAAAAPVASVAIAADELRLLRARALSADSTPELPEVPRAALARIMRGRIEELTGWGLFTQGQTAEAVAALRRAVGVLPEGSGYWRNAQWRLATALRAQGQDRDALALYLRSYDRQAPDAARRAVIEALYTNVNGSLAGLDALIGPAPATAPVAATVTTTGTAPVTATGTATEPATNATAAPTTNEAATPAVTADAPAPPVPNTPAMTDTPAPKPDEPPAPRTPEVPPPAPTPTPAPAPAPLLPAPATTDQAPSVNRPDAGPPPVASGRPRRTSPGAEPCVLSVSVASMLLIGNGSSASVTVSVEGTGRGADISASTPNWADILLLREPNDPAPTAARYTITAISSKAGSYTVNFVSPCGTKELSVTVK